MKKILIILVFLGLLPGATSALTIEDIQKQIQSIAARIATLKAELQRQTIATSTPSGISAAPGSVCLSIGRSLSLGARGDDVYELQYFLAEEGYLLSEFITGYFGSLTEEAVGAWQKANGIVSSGNASTGYGFVGAKTRAAIKAACAPRMSRSLRGEPVNIGAELGSSTASGVAGITSETSDASTTPEETESYEEEKEHSVF